MDYEIYHDESQIDGYWHGIFFVPVLKKQRLLELLNAARVNSHYPYYLSLKNINKKGSAYGCAFSWLTIGLSSLASKLGKDPLPIYLGKRSRGLREYSILREIIGTKLIIFCERDSHNQLTNYPDYGSKVETTFRMGFKGGLHAMWDENNPVEVVKIHFDGYRHYARHIDQDRIISRLMGLRGYCSIKKGYDLIDDRSSNHNKPDCHDFDDCQLLQLTDILVGSFRTYLGLSTSDIHKELAYPVVPLLKRIQKGYARMRNSRWFKSILISRCFLEDNGWAFEQLDYSLDEKYLQPYLLSI